MEPGLVCSGGWPRGEGAGAYNVRWPGCRIRGAARAMPLRPRLALKVHDVEPIGDEVAGVEDGGRASVALAQHALLVARPFHVLQRNGWAWSLTARPTLTSSNPPLDIAGTLTAILRLSPHERVVETLVVS